MQNLIAASGYIQVVFPSDYDFSAQTNINETKTCNTISGFETCFLSDSINCTLDKSTRTLTVQIWDTTDSRALSFEVENITNPTYAETTSSMVISTFNTTSSVKEVSDTSFKITPTPGTLTAALSSADPTAGVKVNLNNSNV